MSTDILLVFPEAQRVLAKQLRDKLEDNLSWFKDPDVQVKIVKDVQAAWQSLEEGHFALIIAHRYLPPDKSPLDAGTRGSTGVGFFKRPGRQAGTPPQHSGDPGQG